MKFGLTEPKKTDKQIVRLIYKCCRNLKDKHRKSLKKQKLESGDDVLYETGDPDSQNVVPTKSKRAKKRLIEDEDLDDQNAAHTTVTKRAKKRLAITEGEGYAPAKKTRREKSKI